MITCCFFPHWGPSHLGRPMQPCFTHPSTRQCELVLFTTPLNERRLWWMQCHSSDKVNPQVEEKWIGNPYDLEYLTVSHPWDHTMGRLREMWDSCLVNTEYLLCGQAQCWGQLGNKKDSTFLELPVWEGGRWRGRRVILRDGLFKGEAREHITGT